MLLIDSCSSSSDLTCCALNSGLSSIIIEIDEVSGSKIITWVVGGSKSKPKPLMDSRINETAMIW